MNRRSLLAAPAIAAAPGLFQPAQAQATPTIVTEEYMVPTPTQGIEVFLRSKRPEGAASSPARTLLFCHGATSPAHSIFDVPLAGVSWMDYIAGRGFDVWCIDLPGFGRSTRPAAMGQPPEANPPLVRGDEALAAIGAAAAFIRQRRNVPKMQMMAWSWGCSLIARYAAENPSLVERLTLHAPQWIREGATPAAAGAGPQLGASDPEGMRRNPAVLRAPNGALLDSREYWQAGRPWWDPAKVTVPTLLVTAEWDRDTPTSMATTLFPLLTASPGKRCVLLAEGTHFMMLERNRGALYQAVQVFLEEAAA
jgi:pimeloyl-ACP methyl ester carboxylesterase